MRRAPEIFAPARVDSAPATTLIFTPPRVVEASRLGGHRSIERPEGPRPRSPPRARVVAPSTRRDRSRPRPRRGRLFRIFPPSRRSILTRPPPRSLPDDDDDDDDDLAMTLSHGGKENASGGDRGAAPHPPDGGCGRVRGWLSRAGLHAYHEAFARTTERSFSALMMSDFASHGVVDTADKQKLFRLIKTLNSEGAFRSARSAAAAGERSRGANAMNNVRSIR